MSSKFDPTAELNEIGYAIGHRPGEPMPTADQVKAALAAAEQRGRQQQRTSTEPALPEPPGRVPLVLGQHPYVILEKIPTNDGCDLTVKADGFGSTDEVVALLLTAVEHLTGVSTNEYVQLVDAIRLAAATLNSADEPATDATNVRRYTTTTMDDQVRHDTPDDGCPVCGKPVATFAAQVTEQHIGDDGWNVVDAITRTHQPCGCAMVLRYDGAADGEDA